MAEKLRKFFCKVAKCSRCYGNSEIVVPMPPDATVRDRTRILIVGEQPHRPTAGQTRLLDYAESDPSVARLTAYLEEAGIARDEVMYVTSVLCFPEDESLRPERPTFDEAKACAQHMRNLIDLLDPVLIIPLGHTAVQGVQWTFPEWTELRQFILNYDVGRVIEGPGLVVYPLYLASSSTLEARPESRQRRDWQRIPSILKSVERRKAAAP
jgi:uracil-DNA glycosylase family 4